MSGKKIALSREARVDGFRLVREIVKRFADQDAALVALANSKPDGYPTMSLPGPSGRGGTSDRVGNVVVLRAGADDKNAAAEALRLFHEATRLLERADSKRVEAFPPEKPKVPAGEEWCSSHARFGVAEPTGDSGRDGLCRFCYGWKLEPPDGIDPAELPLPPKEILDYRSRFGNVTSKVIADYLAGQRRTADAGRARPRRKRKARR